LSIEVGWVWALISIIYVSHVTLFVLVFLSQWCSHLGHLIIVSVHWWWHETCWMSWVDLSVQITWVWTLVLIIYVSDIILSILVLLSEWFSHLRYLIIVSVHWWWHKSSWMSWINLSVQIAWVWTLVLIIYISNIILSILVLLSEWFSHLRYFVIVSINWRRNKTSWMSWVDLRISHVWSWSLVWIVNISNVVLISLVLWDKRLL
jgi:hypothetical protein